MRRHQLVARAIIGFAHGALQLSAASFDGWHKMARLLLPSDRIYAQRRRPYRLHAAQRRRIGHCVVAILHTIDK